MANRCLNKIMLIGNLTRDPELRYTPSGAAVVTLGVATNRRWKTQAGDYKDEAQFHRAVAWNKLAELCSQLLKKGSRVYIEGRIQYRDWEDKEGNKRQTTEVVVGDLIILDSRGSVDQQRDIDVQMDQPAPVVGKDMGTKAGVDSATTSQGDIQTAEDKQSSEPVVPKPVLPKTAIKTDDLVKEDTKDKEPVIKSAAVKSEKDEPGENKDEEKDDKSRDQMPF